jgi:glycosyltransferase involved in cell wall biosynthesis
VAATTLTPKPALERTSTASGLSVEELAVHALAQLPAGVRLELGATGARAMLDLTARAYAIRERVLFVEGLGRRARFVTDTGEIDAATLMPATLGELVERIGGGSPNAVDDSSDASLSGHSVVILTNYPAHYRLPLFEQLSARLSKAGARLHVVFQALETRSRPWLTSSRMTFDHLTLASVRVPGVDRAPLISVRLRRALENLSPTIVLAAGFSPFVAGRAASAAREAGASFGVWSGETADMRTARQGWREPFRRRLLTRSDFAIAYGARAATYLRTLARDLPLVIGRNTAPSATAADRPASSSGERPLRLLLIGDLASTRKGADVAIDAMKHVRRPDVQLRVVGGGRLQHVLERQVATDGRVRLLGPLPPEEVSRELQEADALLFPTRADVFGLALVEAMGVGVAPLVATRAGAVGDLSVDGYNAMVIDSHEPAEWASAIDELAADRIQATELGSNARRTVEARWTIEHAVDAMIAGLRLGALVRHERTPM